MISKPFVISKSNIQHVFKMWKIHVLKQKTRSRIFKIFPTDGFVNFNGMLIEKEIYDAIMKKV